MVLKIILKVMVIKFGVKKIQLKMRQIIKIYHSFKIFKIGFKKYTNKIYKSTKKKLIESFLYIFYFLTKLFLINSNY